jgi:inorganic pyrophosphatase
MANLLRLPASPSPGVIHVVVESPRGATSKIKYDAQLEAFTLQRPLPLGMVYPHDWGFVPGTRAEDGDPLDALVLSEGTTFAGVVIRARPVAVVELEQDAKPGNPGKTTRKNRNRRERNDRVVAVPANAPRADAEGPEDLPARVRAELERFFVDVTFFEDKNATILGWGGPEQAMALVTRSRRRGGGHRGGGR